ncbi:MAG: hypothetical protein EA360_03855 [Balneolaceae bacterium]|nr:MAG: hypothetical protein EA360_03855 [Balneolaceae bacterium]
MSSWKIASTPPHDWFLCLDIDSYFDYEHQPETIADVGFTRPIPLKERDILVTLFFNGETERPEFHVECSEELSGSEIQQANVILSRILGTDLDLRPLYEQASDDSVLMPLLSEYYGLKRMARATLFEDIMNRIIQMRLSHKPTARKMAWKIREAYGTHHYHQGKLIPSWPRPMQLAAADPVQIRKMGPTLRKGEYLTGLAQDILGGNPDMDWLDHEADPQAFYEEISKIKGIGPTSAQDLMLMRPRTDAVFPPSIHKGEEKGLRKWILMSYGLNPDTTGEGTFLETIQSWKGYEAASIEFLYVDWVMDQRKRKSRT